MKTKLLTALFILPLLFIASCKKSELNTLRTGQVSVRMMNDTSATSYEEINIDVHSVQVHIAGATGGDWYKLGTNSGLYNVLTLSNGVDALLVNEKVPTGAITKIRLNPGSRNTIRKNGVLYPVVILPEDKSAFEAEVYGMIDSKNLNMRIIFDGPRSIIQDSQAAYHLKPVMRVYRDTL